jgi:hypothetical protein
MVKWTNPAALMLVLAVASACRAKEGSARDTQPAVDSSVGGSLSSVNVKGNPGMHGKPEDNATATRNYLLALGWGDNLPDSQIVDTATFKWDNDSALIRVVPNDTANTVSWDSALASGGAGYFVAKIYNLEDKTISPLGIGKLKFGYLWVGELSGGARGVAVYTVKNNGKIDGSPKVLSYLGRCESQHPYSGVKLTDGNKCGFGAATGTSSTAPKYILASMTNSAFAVGKGLWITCQGGCCEVSIQTN